MHCGAVHRSWVIKSANADINKQMDTKDMYTHKISVFSHKGQQNCATRGKMDGTGEHHGEQNKPGFKREILREAEAGNSSVSLRPASST